MARLSDLSGAEFISAAQTYVTGYLLPAPTNRFVYARTWYNSEAPRPNAVWTHSLLIPVEVLGAIQSLKQLELLFNRPHGKATLSAYRVPIDLGQLDLMSPATSNEITATGYFRQIIYAFYGQPREPTIVINLNPLAAEVVIDEIWQRQWALLRANFSFCSASLSVRRSRDRSLALQFMPTGGRGSRLKAQLRSMGGIIDASASIDESVPIEMPPYWDEWHSGFGSFCERFADHGSDDRAAMIPLHQAYRAMKSPIDVSTSFAQITRSFPGPDEAKSLKVEWLKSVLTWRDFDSHESASNAIIRLITDERANAFALAISEVPDEGLFGAPPSESRVELLRILDRLGAETLSSLGRSITQRVLPTATVDEMSLYSSQWPHAVSLILEQNAPLLSSVATAGRLSPRTLNELSNSGDIDQQNRVQLMANVLEAVRHGQPDAYIVSNRDSIEALISLTESTHQEPDRRSAGSILANDLTSLLNAIPISRITSRFRAGLIGYSLGFRTAFDYDLAAVDVFEAIRIVLFAELLAEFSICFLIVARFERSQRQVLEAAAGLVKKHAYATISDQLWQSFTDAVDPYSWIPKWDRERWLAHIFVDVALQTKDNEAHEPQIDADEQLRSAIADEMGRRFISRDATRRLERLIRHRDQ